jgi:hypothetical protein
VATVITRLMMAGSVITLEKFALLNPNYEDLFEFRSRKNSYHAPAFALQP